MAQFVEFLAGDADTLERALTAERWGQWRHDAAALRSLDFSLHVTPLDLDALTAAARDVVGDGPVSLTGSLAENVGGDGIECSADVVDRGWAVLWARLQPELVPLVVERSIGGGGEAPEAMVQAVVTLHDFCGEALQRNLAVVLTWSL